MPLARTWSISLTGLDARLVEVEADLALGLPGLTIVGLPDASVSEARDRVRAAVVNSGHSWPSKRITVGLSPASVRKVGAGFDLAIAAAVLAASGVIPADAAEQWLLLGELGLDGKVRPIQGVLPSVIGAAAAGYRQIIVPHSNLSEAQLVPDLLTCGVGTLSDVVGLLSGEIPATLLGIPTAVDPTAGRVGDDRDLDQVVGQGMARLCLEVAAAGGHHLFMVGPPGCGKTMLAERLPSLLPDLDPDTALEVTAVHSVAGVLPDAVPLVTRPPLRAPHHSATLQALIGGGSTPLRPGAISQAHRGVLFLDEAPEFSPRVLDALRQPLESGVVEIARSRYAARFPARFQLVMAANPCPCGLAVRGRAACQCSTVARARYFGRLSGPLLDRIDIKVTMEGVPRTDLLEPPAGRESSAVVAARVAAARRRQRVRLAGTPWKVNAEVPGAALRIRWPLPNSILSKAFEQNGPETGRGLDKVLRLAWTLADLRDLKRPGQDEVILAALLRNAE